MAKQGTLDHPKLIALADALDIDQCFALGILEAIWHFASQYAPTGEIGRFSDRAIATGIRTTLRAEDLIFALVSTGWLDENDECRLTVHDWADHAYGYVLQKGVTAKPRGVPFAAGSDERRNTSGRPVKTPSETANTAANTANAETTTAKGKRKTANVAANDEAITAKNNCPRAQSLQANTIRSQSSPSLQQSATGSPPTLAECQDYAKSEFGLNGSFASNFFTKNSANGWTSAGEPIRDWRKFMRGRVISMSPIERDQFKAGHAEQVQTRFKPGSILTPPFTMPWGTNTPDDMPPVKLVKINEPEGEADFQEVDSDQKWCCIGSRIMRVGGLKAQGDSTS